MYEMLTTDELSVLQETLYVAVENVYRICVADEGDCDVFERYQAFHRDLGYAFIQAGEELQDRLRGSKDLLIPGFRAPAGASLITH